MRFVIGMLALLLLGVGFGGGDAAASPQGKRVMLLGTSNTNPYIGAWTSTFIKHATQAGMKVTNLSSNYDAAVQSQQVDDAIAQKFDMIVIIYVNDQAIVPALTAPRCRHPGRAHVTPLRRNTSCSRLRRNRPCRAAWPARKWSGLQAVGKTKAQIVAVTGAAQRLNVQTRIAAFKAVLAKHPGYQLVVSGGWNTAMVKDYRRVLVRFNARRCRWRVRHGGQPGNRVHPGHQSAGLKAEVASKGIVVVASNCMKDILHQVGQQCRTATQIRRKRPRPRQRRSPPISTARS
jgi:ribose transport system substrate-binding protein